MSPAAREVLVASIVGLMPVAHRRFLISFQKCDPIVNCHLFDLSGIEASPAVQWRFDNLL
jgi:hypothetical protein